MYSKRSRKFLRVCWPPQSSGTSSQKRVCGDPAAANLILSDVVPVGSAVRVRILGRESYEWILGGHLIQFPPFTDEKLRTEQGGDLS